MLVDTYDSFKPLKIYAGQDPFTLAKPVWNEQICLEKVSENITFSPGGVLAPPGVTINADFSLSIAPSIANVHSIASFTITYNIEV